ncbi:MAG: prepilin-type N-terminal cleavage/methylation domain-containing protein [Candidatus Staskawiczbacteria bacterium]|jgi:prepilin-type N-terminal cleavage/methylation domain-containing protein
MNKQKGFTIIELAISIFILSIAVIGIFNALSIVIILTSDASDRLTATYLAQEGMEIVRNIRDTNWLNMDSADASNELGSSYSWVDGLTLEGYNYPVDCKQDNVKCKADYTSTKLSSATRNDYLRLDTNGFYSETVGTETKFQRRITVIPIQDVDNAPLSQGYHIIKVKSQVSWDRKSTVLSEGVLANKCCPNDGPDYCPAGVSNCIITEGTLYNWYNTKIFVKSVEIVDGFDVAYPGSTTVSEIIGKGTTSAKQFYSKIYPANATIKDVSWSSNNPEVTVSDQGLVTVSDEAPSGDYAEITVTSADRGDSDTITIQVASNP